MIIVHYIGGRTQQRWGTRTRLGLPWLSLYAQTRFPHLRLFCTLAANENTNKRVLWFSIAEAAVLISMGLWQIYYLRSFFEKKRAF